MSMPLPPKCSRIDKFIKKQWANYLKMSLRYCRDQLEEEEEEENVVKLINDELKEDKHDTRRSSDPDPNLAFIINKTRAYYESYSNDWTGSFTGYPMVREGILLDEIEAECGTRFIIADLSTYYLNNKTPDYEDPILHEWAIYWNKEYDNSRCRANEKREVVARLVHFFGNLIDTDHAAELCYKSQIERPKNAAKSYPRVPRQTRGEFQLTQKFQMASWIKNLLIGDIS
ncbi:hypothetical protein ABEW05_007640 [Botrytis cinerea]